MQVYQFTPPAHVEFPIPDTASAFEVWQGFRPGSYEEADQSDGADVNWDVRLANGEKLDVWDGLINPRDDVAQRKLMKVTAPLPPGRARTLLLEVGVGPAGDGAWDWVVFGGLQVQ